MMPLRHFRRAGLLALLGAAACRPDSAPTDNATVPTPPGTPPPATPAPAIPESTPPSSTAAPTDTLRLAGGQTLLLRPSSAAAFDRLAAEALPPEGDSAAPDQDLAPTQGRVRRQELDLLLQPAQGPVVKLHTTPPAEFTIQNPNAVRYVYRGSLPTAHQWVVQAWFWESAATVLVDQRTGRQLEVPGQPAASPDGRYVLCASPGLGGGDQVNSLSLVQIDAAGPRRMWQQEPARWAPEEARWAGPRRAIIRVSRADADGQLPDPPRPEYLELTLPPNQ